MAGLVMGCPSIRVYFLAGKPWGVGVVDGCKVEGEVTYFDRILRDEDEYAQCVINLGTFRTFVCAATFDTPEAEIACMLLEPD